MMLSAIATSMITVAGITFSPTISSLSHVSGQLTARVLRNSISNTTNKVVLGFYIGLFASCLTVIRTKDDAAGPFMPTLSIPVEMGLAIIDVGVRLNFIHYMAFSVQASTVASAMAEEALKRVNTLYPHPLSVQDNERVPALSVLTTSQQSQVVRASKHGYVRLIDEKNYVNSLPICTLRCVSIRDRVIL